MISTQRMQQIYDSVLAQKQLQLSVGGGISLDGVRVAFVQMRQILDAEGATDNEKATFRQVIKDAITAGHWRVAAHRDRTVEALDSALDNIPLAVAADEQVVSPGLAPVIF